MQDAQSGTVLLGDREREGARPDEDVLRDVLQAFDGDTALLPFRRHIAVSVRDGLVRLAGHVPNPTLRNAAANLAWSVGGVEGVLNELFDDWRLRVDVAQALSRDPRLHGLPLRVESDLGEVSISGRIPSPTVRPQAAEVVQRVRGVVAVDVRGLEAGPREASTRA